MLGQTIPLTAVGTVSLEGNQLVVDVEKAAGAGVDVPGFLVNRASDLLDLRYDIPALPFGLAAHRRDPGRGRRATSRVQATNAVLGG